MVRPSSNSNVSLLSVIWTDMMSGGGVLFRFIPSLQQFSFVCFQDTRDFVQFRFTKPFVPTQLDWRQPELRLVPRLVNVHVR